MDPIFNSILNVTTVLELAVYLEEQGIDFYRKQQQAVEEESYKSVFGLLAEEETKHRDTFIRLLNASGLEYLELEKLAGEYRMFMDMLVKEALQLLKIKKSMTLQDVVLSAIRFEKETLLLYYEIASIIDEKDRGLIMQICEEEKNHIAKLLSIKLSNL